MSVRFSQFKAKKQPFSKRSALRHGLVGLFGLIILFFSNRSAADIYALHDVHRTGTRLAAELEFKTYARVYEIQISARAGDIFRIAGQIEVTEEDEVQNKAWTYLSVRPAASNSRTRVSSFAWQIVKRGHNNHHMPMHLFGYYEAPSTADYVIEIMARTWFTNDSQVAVEKALRCAQELREDPDYVGCKGKRGGDLSPRNPEVDGAGEFGQIVVEQYRSYGSVQEALGAGAKLLVDIDRAPFVDADLDIVDRRDNQNRSIKYELPRTKSFMLEVGDLLRMQGAATAQFATDIELFALELSLCGDARFRCNDVSWQCDGPGANRRLSISTENIFQVLFRFTLQNDGYCEASSPGTAAVVQKTFARLGSKFLVRKGGSADLVAMHFADTPGGAYLAGSRHLTAAADSVFSTSDEVVELLDFTGRHRAGDTLRVQSQLQLEMTSGNVGAACWARVEVYENNAREYLSIFDQRFLRNSADADKDHDSGTFAPFAVYQTRQPGEHKVRLIADCNATSAATIRAKDYGRHLTIDRFSAATTAVSAAVDSKRRR